MIDRTPRPDPDPFLDWKVRIFFAGAVLLALAVIFDRDVLALVAAAVLGIGVVVGLVQRARRRRE